MVNLAIFGDSNVSRNRKSVVSDFERLKGSVFRPVTTLILLKDNLHAVSQSTKLLIVSALPNPISRLAFDGSESTLRVELTALLEEVSDTVV